MEENFVEEMRSHRAQTDQNQEAVAELSLRLLDWMQNAGPGAGEDAGEIAARIEAGLRQLTGARAVAVLARRAPEDDLLLLATTNAAPEVLAASGAALPFFPARHLLAELPAQPLLLAQAEPHLQVFLGELWDFTRETLGDLIGTQHSDEAQSAPAWIVPLPAASDAQAPDAQEDVAGVALLWMENGNALPTPLRLALAAAASQAGNWMHGALRLERLGRSYHQFAVVMAEAVESLAPEEAQRGRAVAYYAGLVAEEMHLSQREAERIDFAALLHGIGKIGVPQELLNKTQPLSAEERELVRGALVAGAERISQVEGLEEVALIVRHQGEQFDGGGYPDGLRGEAIPLGSRVLAAALRFASMTNARSDRRAMPLVGGGLQSLHREAGAALDPQVAAAFLRVMGREA